MVKDSVQSCSAGSAEVRDMLSSIPELWGKAGPVTLPDAAFNAIAAKFTQAVWSAKAEAAFVLADEIKLRKQLTSALRDLLVAVKAEPAMHGRQFVQLGIQVTNAIHAADVRERQWGSTEAEPERRSDDLRNDGIDFANKEYDGSPSQRLAFNHGVKWALAHLPDLPQAAQLREALETVDSEVVLTGHLKEIVDRALAGGTSAASQHYLPGHDETTANLEELKVRR